jgi:hypothetical protein
MKWKLPADESGAVSYWLPSNTNAGGAPQNAIGSKARRNVRYPAKVVVLGTIRYIKVLCGGAIVTKLQRGRSVS